jgi:hypothetical protein
MNQKLPEPSKSGGGFLIFTLVALFALGAFIVLNILSLGAFTWVIAITIGIAVVGAFHYLLWGHDLTQQVAEDREAFLRQQARDRERDEGWRG